jgi:hypothetical protein
LRDIGDRDHGSAPLVALLNLKRIGLIAGSQLTPAAEQLLAEAARNAFAA